MGEEVTYQVKRDIDLKLVVNKSEHVSNRRSAIKLIACVPAFYEEDEEITIATFGTDGNFSVSREAVERAGLTLEQS